MFLILVSNTIQLIMMETETKITGLCFKIKINPLFIIKKKATYLGHIQKTKFYRNNKMI